MPGVLVYTDGTNYFTMRGVAGSGAPTIDKYVLGALDASLPNAVANPTAYYGVDVAPAVAGSLDDEFNGSVFDTVRWTSVSFRGVATTTVSNSLLTFNYNAADSNQSAIVQTAPATPWTVVQKVTMASLPVSGATYRLCGISVFATGTVTAAKCIFFSFKYTNGAFAFGQDNFTNITTFSSTPASITPPAGSVPTTVWLQLKNDGTNFTFSYSVDGVNYNTLTTYAVATWTGTVGYVGIVIGGSQTAPTLFSTDYFRRTQ
jgi:hypothetical protein